jgi:hypothetical protein
MDRPTQRNAASLHNTRIHSGDNENEMKSMHMLVHKRQPGTHKVTNPEL